MLKKKRTRQFRWAELLQLAPGLVQAEARGLSKEDREKHRMALSLRKGIHNDRADGMRLALAKLARRRTSGFAQAGIFEVELIQLPLSVLG